jgi:sugar/nucleoside kinase (ribokinase family)
VAFVSAAHLTEPQALDWAGRWLERGAHTVVLTRGDHGSLAVTAEAVFRCGIREVPVIDTLGAGDAFIAGYICGLLRNESIQSCLERGRDLGAEALQRFGAFGHGVSLDALGITGEALAWKPR